ncbi:MAG: hypothetical protein HPY81_07625 [Firmicutes bacterium]|nr:hypothetical protein [Bacillota bacterium]
MLVNEIKPPVRTVQILCASLSALGYYPWQIKQIILEVAGTTNLKDLDEQQLEQLADELRRQYEFALKCLAVTRSE